MESKQGYVMALANSIIGVSILAMPYCFKQCGIVLSIVLLIFSSAFSRLACHFLLKSAFKARLKSFEYLAYHVFGSLGKFAVEIGLIGFLLGTCIAYFVVMGDLGPQIITQITESKQTSTLRTAILIAIAVFCVLPLGLLKNLNSLNIVCSVSIAFYACLVLKIMGEAAPHLLQGDWYNNVNFWRPAGIMQCLPIFSMALSCQTQLFEIYQIIPNASLEKMNDLIRLAINICTSVYIFVGTFGYIAVSHELNFSGNILMNFQSSVVTEVMKIGFVLSVAFSFPLVIFPCRASLYSLFYKPTYTSVHESTTVFIPEGKFRGLTLLIISISLVIGILIPNIELVLGLVGSTIGVMICILFPVSSFICLTSKNTNERILAQIMLFMGIIVMVMGTYTNLYAIDQASYNAIATEKTVIKPYHVNIGNLNNFKKEPSFLTTLKNIALDEQKKKVVPIDVAKEVRHEPPQPEAPKEDVPKPLKLDSPSIPEIKILDIKKEESKPAPIEISITNQANKKSDDLKTVKNLTAGDKIKINDQLVLPKSETEQKIDLNKAEQKIDEPIDKLKKNEEVDIEAIRKEDNELKEAKQENKVDKMLNMQEHQKIMEVQQKLVEEQKKLMEVLKMQHEKEKQTLDIVNEEKVKAVKSIENFAKLAIKSLVDSDKPKLQEEPIKTTIKASSISQAVVNRTAEVIKPPIPIALANSLERQKKTENKSPDVQEVNILDVIQGNTLNNNTNVPEKPKILEEVKVIDDNDVKNDEKRVAAARDILSDDYKRKKREIDDEHCDKSMTDK